MHRSRTLFLLALAAIPLAASAATTAIEKPAGLTALTSAAGTITSTFTFNQGPADAFANDGSKRMLRNGKTLNLMYTFPAPTLVNSYGICAGGSYFEAARGPKAWKIYGSNDYSATDKNDATATWVELDSRSDETGWANNEYRFYLFNNGRSYTTYKIDITANNGNQYTQWKYLEYFHYAQNEVVVTGDPAEYGDIAYGAVHCEPGAPVALTAFDGPWTNSTGSIVATCTGYEIYELDSDGNTVMTGSGASTSCSFTMPGGLVTVKWKFSALYGVGITSAGNGSVQAIAEPVAGGTILEPAITPASGYAFYKWNALEGSVSPYDEAFMVKGPTTLEAVFAPAVDLAPGTNVISAAVDAAGSGNLVLRLAPGTYYETEGTNCVSVAKPIHIVGLGDKPEDVVVRRTAASSRIFYLDHADALVKNVSMVNGYGATNKQPTNGGNVYIAANGGTVEDCLIANGSVNTYNSQGGNVYMEAGRLSRCVVTNGYTSTGYGAAGSGGVTASGSSLVENCLLYRNMCAAYSSNGKTVAAGARLKGSAQMVNCTLAANGTTSVGYGACYADESAKVVNCAMFENIARDDGTGCNQTWGGTQGAYLACASEVLINAACLQTDNPAFAAGGYELSVSSPLRDAGADYGALPALSGTDLLGAARISGRAVDIGCYEFAASGLTCDFTADVAGGITPAAVTFTATAEGATGVPEYRWDFDGDGVVDQTTSDAIVTHAYAAGGVYTVSLSVSCGGSTATAEHEDMIKTCQADVYVSTTGAAAYPYATWADATPSLQDALAATVDGCTVHIAPGGYSVEAQLPLTGAVRIVGESGDPADVTIAGTKACRVFYMDNAAALVAGVTVRGTATGNGKSILLENTGGTVSNCVVYGSSAGTVGWSVRGAALCGARAHVTHCVFLGTGSISLGDGAMNGAAVHLTSGSRIENSLVKDFSTVYSLGNSTDGGNVVSLNGGSAALNCTVVGGTNSTAGASAIYCDGTSAATNCVAADICNASGAAQPWKGTAANFVACAFDGGSVPNETCFAGTAAEFFRNYAQGDLRPDGALMDNGVNYDGMAALDLAGGTRVIGAFVDVGCYESPARATIILCR